MPSRREGVRALVKRISTRQGPSQGPSSTLVKRFTSVVRAQVKRASDGTNLGPYEPCDERPLPREMSRREERAAPCWGLRLKAQGLGFRVQGSGFRVRGSGFRV